MLPLVYEAKMRCTQYWYEVLTGKVYEGRLLQRIARQVVQFGPGSWLRSIGRCIAWGIRMARLEW